jgi:hypothetical protein
MIKLPFWLSRLVRGDLKNLSGASLTEKPATGLTTCARVFLWSEIMSRRKNKLFPKGGLQSLYSKILWITPRRNCDTVDEILEIIAYTQNAGSVVTAPPRSVGLMLANDETQRNRIGLIWQKDNKQYGHTVPVATNHKYLIRKLIKAVR